MDARYILTAWEADLAWDDGLQVFDDLHDLQHPYDSEVIKYSTCVYPSEMLALLALMDAKPLIKGPVGCGASPSRLSYSLC